MKKFLVWACFALFSGELCFGTQFIFTGLVSTEWFNRTNWVPMAIPQAGDDVLIKAQVFVPETAAFSTMTIEGGAVGGQFNVTRAVALVDGSLDANVTVVTGGVLEFRGEGRKHLNGQVTNHGTVRWSGAHEIRASFASQLLNKSDGLFLIENDQSYIHWGGALPSLINEGTIRKNGATGVTSFNTIRFVNRGLTEIQTGRLALVTGAVTSGEFRVSEGAWLELQGGTVTLEPGATFTGAGFYGVTGSVDVNGEITSANFQVKGAMKGTNTISGKVNWSDGLISSQTVITPTGVLAINQDGVKHFSGATVENNGTIRWSELTEVRVSDSQIVNKPGGLIEILNNEHIGHFGGTTAVLVNQGLIRKSGSTGTTTFGAMDFENAGVVEIQSGQLVLTTSFTTSGEFKIAAGARLELAGGIVTLSPGALFTGAGFYGVTGTVMVNGEITSENFQVTGALKGKNTISGRLNWSDGLIGSEMVITPTGLLLINKDGVKHFSTATVENNGTIRWSDVTELRMSDAQIVNKPGAVIEILNNERMGHFGGTTAGLLNQGLIRKSSSTGPTVIAEMDFQNVGVVDIQSGQLVLPSSFTTSGEFKVAEGARLELAGGVVTLSPGALFTGAGFYGVTGTVMVNGEITSENFQVTGALKGKHTISGRLNWSDGLIGSEMVITPTGLLLINKDGVKHFTGATVENHGTIRWSDVTELRMSNAQIVNKPGAVIEILNDERMGHFGGTTAGLLNQGLIRKSSSTGPTVIAEMEFQNVGVVDIQSGQVVLPSSFTTSGEVKVAQGARLELAGGVATLAPGALFRGAGFYGVTGTVEVNGEITSGNFQVTGALRGVNSIAGVLNWGDGMLSSETTIKTGGMLLVSGIGVQHLTGAKLVNNGTIRWPGAGELRVSDASIVNAAGGVIEMMNDQWIGHFAGANNVPLVNDGTIRKSGAGTTTTFTMPVTQKGNVEIESGALAFNAPYVQTAGTTKLQGSLIAPEVQVQGGTLAGGGLVRGNLINSSRVETGFPHGELVVQGDYEQTGALVVAIPSDAPESFGLKITGKATLGGQLDVLLANGFVPTFGERFVAVEFASSTGAFATINKPAIFTTEVTAQEISFTLPKGFEITKDQDGNFRFEITVAANKSYLVEASTDLREWVSLGVFTAANGSLSFTDPESGGMGMRFYRINEVPGQ